MTIGLNSSDKIMKLISFAKYRLNHKVIVFVSLLLSYARTEYWLTVEEFKEVISEKHSSSFKNQDMSRHNVYKLYILTIEGFGSQSWIRVLFS